MTTYLELTNRLLRRINEPELDVNTFDSARGIHATCVDVIRDVVSQINNMKDHWIFNAVQHTQLITIGQNEYPWPVRWSVTDWNSFQIKKDDTLSINNRTLTYINRNEWYEKRGRDRDYDLLPNGSIPLHVFEAHGQGWGLTPAPDKAYTITYRYFRSPDPLQLPTDICVIPDKFDYVIISGGLYHMSMFKSDPEKTAMMKSEYNQGVNEMVRQQISWSRQVDDKRVFPNRMQM